MSKRLGAAAILAACVCVCSIPAQAAGKTITVAADGSGDFRTVQEAFAAVPDNSVEPTVIRIKPGTYPGQKVLANTKHKVTLQGENATTTVLTYHANVKEPESADARYKGTGLVVLADDFRAERITIENTSGDHGQALALRIDGDRAVLSNTRLLGWQDTLMLNNGRHYFKDCYIEGRVDFIYGSATAVFEGCEIRSKNGGYVTAASTPPERPYGFVFIRSRLTGAAAPWVDPSGAIAPKPQSGPAQAYLGRPWRPYGAVAFIDCEMGEHIKPEGWHNWGKPEQERTARYAEYGSRGPGAKPAQRVAWARQLTQAEAARMTAAAILAGSDGWQP
jgi:pectinesterase